MSSRFFPLPRTELEAVGRVAAFYLPQFHPIPENDAWWGPGFTEWHNVVTAGPQFRGHHQPHLPGDLGFYDLRVPETRQAQAALARDHGIGVFCYYHYWFSGRRLLGRPLDEVLSSGEPEQPFLLCWANESWRRTWTGRVGELLLEQTYSPDDDAAHIRWLLPVLADPRYLRLDGRPVLLVYRASSLPDPARTLRTWRDLARVEGVGELLLLRVESMRNELGDPRPLGFDAAVEFQPDWGSLPAPRRRLLGGRVAHSLSERLGTPSRVRIYDYADLVARMTERPLPPYPRFPCVTPQWDNTARRAEGATVFDGSTPAVYERWLSHALATANGITDEPLVFVNSWNEWAEGAHLEPDRRWGRGYLRATRSALQKRARVAAR